MFKDDGTIASGMAHDHVIRATEWSGRARFDADRPSDCELSLQIPIEGLAVDDPELREELGYERTLDDGQRAEVRAAMLAEGQLDAESHPAIGIEAAACERVGDRRFRARVTVTVGGTSAARQPVLRISRGGDGRVRLRARFELRHDELGLTPYSAFLGAVRNAQPIRFVTDRVLVPAERGGGER